MNFQSPSRRVGHLISALVLLVCSSLFVAISLHIDLFADLENSLWDRRLALLQDRVTADPAIKIIMIDQGSIEYMAREEHYTWPWPRSMYEPVLEFLREGGARAVAFDMLFTEPSSAGVEDDRTFAQSLSGTMPVVSAVGLSTGRISSPQPLIQRLEERLREAEQTHHLSTRYFGAVAPPSYTAATVPTAELLETSHAFGSAVADNDNDGVYRHALPGAFLHHTPILSLPFSLYEAVSPGALANDALRSFFDEQGRLTVRFHNPERSYSVYPIHSVIVSFIRMQQGLDPLINPAEFRDAWVFIGMSAQGLLDLRPLPLHARAPGVMYHATVLDNLIHRSFVRVVPVPVTITVAVFFIAALLAVIMIGHGMLGKVVGVCVLFASLIGIGILSAEMNYWLPLAAPLLGMTVATTASFALQYYREGRQHRFVKNAFRHYVSPTVIEQIISDPSALSLGGARRELTIFFSDIAGFTSISESIEPARLVELLNIFLSEMTDVILRSGGTVDKYVGDAIVAFWNAPLATPDHAERATRAAIECQSKLHARQPEFMTRFKVPIKMRVGLHTGVVSVGNFGSRERFNYTVVGDAANLASRLEGVNKVFGSLVLVSESTRRACGESLTFREVGSIKVVGKNEVIAVFEPLGAHNSSLTPEHCAEFRSLIQRFNQGDRQEILGAMERLGVIDPVAAAYARRIRQELEIARESRSAIWNLSEK